MMNIAKKLASKSQHKQHHHACIITKGGKIIATGYNHRFMHAEVDALRKMDTRFWRTRKKSKGLTLYSFRWRKGGGFGNARPCAQCRLWIDSTTWGYKIDTVYYTNDKGQLVKL